MLITSVRYIKPSIITTILRANTLIADTEFVSKITQTSSDKKGDYDSYNFAVQYNDFRTQRHAPDNLQLKLGKPRAEQAKREVDFYQGIALPMQARLGNDKLRFPRCYDAYYDEVNDQFHLILDGLNKDYAVPKDKMPPTARHREQLIETLATIHAYWWDHPLLGELIPLPTQDSITSRINNLQTKLSELKQAVGKHLNPDHMAILDLIATGLPQASQNRFISNKGLTIIHGNLSPDNVLYSLRETAIINWEYWDIGFGTDDLAMMIPLNWSVELRKFQEQALLKRYYDILVKNNVQDYSWTMLNHDYKVSLANIIGNLLLQWTWNKHSTGHWRLMENAIDNFILMDGTSIYI